MILTSFLPRAIAFLLIIQVPIWALADALAPAASGFAYGSIADKICAEMESDKDKSKGHFLDIAQHYNLAWIHLSDKSRQNVSLSTRPKSLPELTQEQWKVIEQKENRFVEISRPLGRNDDVLSLGFRCPGLFDSLMNKQIWPGQLPVGTIAIAFALNALALLGAYLISFGIPLHKLLKKLAPGDDLPEHYPPFVSSELPAISIGVTQRLANLKGEHEKNNICRSF